MPSTRHFENQTIWKPKIKNNRFQMFLDFEYSSQRSSKYFLAFQLWVSIVKHEKINIIYTILKKLL